MCVSVCECVCVCQTTVSRAAAPGLCPCSLLILAANAGPSLAGQPCPWAPRPAGVSLWYNADTLVCRGRGGGATQLSSSLQCQEEDGQGSPELWVGLAGGSTARHYHHCDRREKGDRPGFWSTRQGQQVAGRQLVCGKARYPAPSLCGV